MCARAGLISALVFCASGAALMYSNEARPYSAALALGLALLPLFFIFTVSHAFDIRVWVPRCFVCYELGIALAAGLLLAQVRSGAALKAAAVGLTAVSLAARAGVRFVH